MQIMQLFQGSTSTELTEIRIKKNGSGVVLNIKIKKLGFLEIYLTTFAWTLLSSPSSITP